jgi:hypothetical protein
MYRPPSRLPLTGGGACLKRSTQNPDRIVGPDFTEELALRSQDVPVLAELGDVVEFLATKTIHAADDCVDILSTGTNIGAPKDVIAGIR